MKAIASLAFDLLHYFKIVVFIYMFECFFYMYVCILHLCLVPKELKRLYPILGDCLELQTAVSCQLGTGIQTWVFWKNLQCS